MTGSGSNLFGMSRERLGVALAPIDSRRYRVEQVYRWLYGRRSYDPAGWTDLSKELRSEIAGRFVADPGTIDARAAGSDGTIKYRIRLSGGGMAESVSMIQGGRHTLCLSSQVGCALACSFCLTGQMGLRRHLDPGEIVGQVALIVADRGLEDSFNVVFMGMGEPLHNYDAVMEAVRLLADPHGFGLSRRRITVSTVGLVPKIERLAGETTRPRLAVSLNATTDDLRERLMPVNRRYPLAELLGALRRFADRTGDRFTFEYVLIGGVNDGDDDASRLVRLARGLPAKVNLIPFNEVPDRLPYRQPDPQRVERFRSTVVSGGVPASVRWSRGREVRAACGQLALPEDEGSER